MAFLDELSSIFSSGSGGGGYYDYDPTPKSQEKGGFAVPGAGAGTSTGGGFDFGSLGGTLDQGVGIAGALKELFNPTERRQSKEELEAEQYRAFLREIAGKLADPNLRAEDREAFAEILRGVAGQGLREARGNVRRDIARGDVVDRSRREDETVSNFLQNFANQLFARSDQAAVQNLQQAAGVNFGPGATELDLGQKRENLSFDDRYDANTGAGLTNVLREIWPDLKPEPEPAPQQAASVDPAGAVNMRRSLYS